VPPTELIENTPAKEIREHSKTITETLKPTEAEEEEIPVEEEKIKRVPTGNFLVRLFKKLFFYYFPHKPRPTSTT